MKQKSWLPERRCVILLQLLFLFIPDREWILHYSICYKCESSIVYSETSEERTRWEQDSCPLLRGCPYVRGWLAGHTPNLELSFKARCWISKSELNILNRQKSTRQRSGQSIWATKVQNLTLFLWFVLAVLVFLHSRRLCFRDCYPLGAYWLSVVQSREVSASPRFQMYYFYRKSNRGAWILSAVLWLSAFRRVHY